MEELIMKLNTLSLFTGAGGLDIGFEENGFNITVANEWNKNAANTYQVNHPNVKLLQGDIEKYLDYLYSLSNVDVVIGGPPCQGFSVAGKMDVNDPRNKMVWHFLNVVQHVKPQAFVIENVKALYQLAKWAPIREKIINISENMGYSITPILLNAVDYGVPQKRYRVFFIAFKNKDVSADEIAYRLQQKKRVAPTVREALATIPKIGSKGNPLDSTAKITFATNPILRKSAYAGMLFNGAGRPINIDEYANTLPASMGGNKTPIIDDEALYNNKKNFAEIYRENLDEGYIPEFKEAPKRLRRLSIKEASLLQTFPKDYEFTGPMSSQYTQIGNAVPPLLASSVAKVVKDILSNTPMKKTKKSPSFQLNIFN
ncbi:C-5 cytosine-specific DNA methylase [Lentilactobacillus farraginis DSM 18382 = JCM 14108]|jgi:DNA (cytosine-5)-methyltransferase 1|uniref:Cytosine-specific methyltransferase n=2 Tax=Lentilactobacillus farraginis DSM 18382 = JCM 14108 TaxID=1423743 RepID=A0A0R1WBD3_9LACO|nr:C-5 cytosine-specific DNA methylase [Lentilactobacillus farraginis DSM 18382 = JCM 14108]MQM78986.1 DNA cytosine methyltransferase [Lentilactobacillus buchneri]